MSSHVELNPDDSTLGLSLGMKAMRLALTQKTHKIGTVRIPTQGDADVIIGDGASDGVNRIDQDGRQLPLVDTSGIDKAAKDAQRKADAAAAKADQVRSDLQAEVDKVKANVADADAKAEQAKTSAEAAASKADSDKAELDKSVAALDKRVSDVSAKGDKLADQITDITGTVNGQQTKLNEFGTKLEGEITKNDTTVKSVSELKQTVTELSSTVSQTTKTASDALSKATSVKQTADGLKATLSKDYQTTKQADGKYSTKTELSATSESLSAGITSVKKTADGAVTSANAAQATADGVKATLSKDYTSTKNADLKYSTKAELSATSDSLSASITSVKKMADGAVTAASKAQQTADAVTLNLSKNYNTKAQNDALYATQTSLKATSDSLSAKVTANAKTAQSAVDKATSLEANLNGFKTTVSDTYMAKGIGDEIIENGIPNPDRPNKFGLKIVNGVFQRTFPGGEHHVDYGPMHIMHTIGPHRTIRIAIDVRLVSGKDTVSDADAINALGVNVGWNAIQVFLKDLVDGEWHSYERYIYTQTSTVTRAYASSHVGSDGVKVLQFRNASIKDVTSDYKTYSTKSELIQTANSIKAQVTEVSKTANSAMSKATTVEQTANGLSSKITEQGKTLDATVTTANEAKSTADSNKTTISQISTAASDALSKASTVEQNLSGFKTTVSQTYTTKNDFNNLTIGGRNLLLNSNFSKGTDNWVLELQNNGLGTVKAEALSGFAFATTMLTINVTKSTTNLCRIYQLRSPNPMRTDTVDTVSFWATASESVPVQFGRNDDQRFITVQKGWRYYKATVSKWNGSNAFVIGFKNGFVGTLKITNIMWEHASKASQWSPAPEDLQPAGDYSTKSYVDQTAKSVALGVVQNYKGSDGSGLATKSDITVAKDSITSTVASTYATASGVTEEISSKITQNNNSLDVKFATKAENQTAQDTANAAKSDASKAQSRIGTLESCISLTSDGVQVGKRSNGEFTGPSALVGTDGVFHVKNRDSNGKTDDVVKLGQDVLVVKSKLAQSGGGYIDRLVVGPYGDDHFAIRLSPALAADASNSSEPVQMWQTGWQNVTTGKGCEVYGHASYGYQGGCLRFRGRVKTTIDGDNSLFDNPGVLKLWVSTMNRNFLLPAYRDNTLGWANAYIPANSRQVKIHGVWDWVSLDQLSIAQ